MNEFFKKNATRETKYYHIRLSVSLILLDNKIFIIYYLILFIIMIAIVLEIYRMDYLNTCMGYIMNLCFDTIINIVIGSTYDFGPMFK